MKIFLSALLTSLDKNLISKGEVIATCTT
jgi:hypothetical protein